MVLDLDANATYAPSERLQGVISSAWSRLGNPSSIHRGGQRAKAAIEGAREVLRELIGATRHDTVIFTSGATEANNLIVSQISRAGRPGRAVSSTIEHPCVLAPLQYMATRGHTVSYVVPQSDGEVTASAFLKSVTTEDTLVTLIAANNETGIVNDIAQVASQAKLIAPRSIIHSDCAQLVGKLPVNFRNLGLDAMTISGHKFGALSGVGALILREEIEITPLILGGPQENKLRGGSENVLGIISLAAAASEVIETLDTRIQSMSSLRDAFESELLAALPDVEINGVSASRLPNTCSVRIPGVIADDLVVALDLQGVLISSGAACSSGKPEPSHVLLAMGRSEEQARSTIRVSFRADQPLELVPRAVACIVDSTLRMRRR